MATVLTGIVGLISSGLGAAAPIAAGIAGPWGASLGAGAAAASVAGTAATGLSLTSILQGTATVLGIASTLAGANAEADALNLQADDATAEQASESLQGVKRRASILREMKDAVAAQDVAYAASGVDLSFGTAGAARTDAYREADLALSTDAGTQMSRQSRLFERAQNYRSAAKRAKRMGIVKAVQTGIGAVI